MQHVELNRFDPNRMLNLIHGGPSVTAEALVTDDAAHPLMYAVKHYCPGLDLYTVRAMMRMTGADQIKVISNFLNLPYSYVSGWFEGYASHTLNQNGHYSDDFVLGFRDGRSLREVYPPK